MVVEARTTTIRQGGSRIWDPRDAVAELADAIWQQDAALVGVEIGDRSEHQRLARAGGAGDREALRSIQSQVDRSAIVEPELLEYETAQRAALGRRITISSSL